MDTLTLMRALPTVLMFVLLLAACSDSTSSSLAGTTSSPEAPAATGITSAVTTTTTSAPTTTVAVTAVPLTTLTIAGGEASILVYEGQVAGPGRLEVKLGTIVSLTVGSDISDEIHVHGYDISADVVDGTSVQIEFAADIPGIFEVELEGARLELLELVVAP